ncbi:FKBP-type peptidyl-prolyl cis-trans isomerase [Reichenbachiella ulvae]|uniref:Peptidyl-prolyl cis-trans isomerase n=1 Tax=Reichenbachiella ulvae TaxID=2980104 RepID=A0ABT3CRV2_9BACT|nr:FKBP-type peptidyl-prolyl cis-trans isomerase [Reichenbachiella ulvae]MCV9386440.1 FKBP-type peptidyl-prolyl cis-trans isomerase [Reichenbachiella ulvae]
MKMLNRLKNVGMMAALAIVGFACLEESEIEKQQKANEKAILNYLETNNIQAEQSSYGLYYEKLTSNSAGAEPAAGQVISVKYEIKTLGGQLLESVTDTTVDIKVNWSSVLPVGINYGIDVLREGEKGRFYLPAHVAYDSYSPDDNSFGPYTNFIVDLELVDIKTEDDLFETEIDLIEAYIGENNLTEVQSKANGLYHKTLEAGDGEEPLSYNYVTLHFKRSYLDGTVIAETEASKPLTVRLNENALVEGFYQGVLEMKEGEKALLIMPSELAFGGSVQVMPSSLREELFENGFITTNVRPYSPVMYEVELLEVK